MQVQSSCKANMHHSLYKNSFFRNYNVVSMKMVKYELTSNLNGLVRFSFGGGLNIRVSSRSACSLPSQLHLCMSLAYIAAPLNLALLSMKSIFTPS